MGQRVRQPHHALLVGVPDDQGARAVGEHLAQRDDLTGGLVPARLHDGERLVQPHRLAAEQLVDLDRRGHRDPHLATGGEHVDRAILVRADEHAVATRRLSQPVDLLAERHQLVAGVLERVDQLRVALGELGDPGRRVGQPLLEQPRMPGGFRELATQQRHLVFQKPDLAVQFRSAALPVLRTIGPAAGTIVHARHLLPCSRALHGTGDLRQT
jgi:hypothetical protein